MEFLARAANILLKIEPWAIVGGGIAAGLGALVALESERWRAIGGRLLTLGLVAVILPWSIFNGFVHPSFASQVGKFPVINLIVAILWATGAMLAGLSWLRWAQPAAQSAAKRLTRVSALQRNERTDVRRIDDFLPAAAGEFDPREFFDLAKGFFLGLGESLKAAYLKLDTFPHAQVVGTTGAGKGVMLAIWAAQCLLRGIAVVWLDPKNDEWAPHVLAAAAKAAGRVFILIDLRPAEGPQINLFWGATAEQIEELFLAGFSLAEKGSDADFYRLADRQAAHRMAQAAAAGGGLTPAALYNKYGPELRETAPGFAGLLQEMAAIPAVNAREGLDLRRAVEDGAALYFVGSMRNAKVIRLQRMVLVKLVQLAEERDRTKGKPRPICAVLDEAKYHVSRPALEALSASRDKGLHMILAHQSQADLRDCPADLDPDAVVGAVMENCALKIVYRVQDPVTAEWLARKSGRIQVDDEMRRVRRNAALSETVDPDRQIRQAERFLIDENMILNLRPSQAVVFGAGLPRFITTAPLKVAKDPANLVPRTCVGDALQEAQDLFDLSKPEKPF